MSKAVVFLKKEPVLIIGSLLMAISMFWVKPSARYLNYIDFRVLTLLFCLMAVVAGLKEQGVFHMIANTLGKRVKTVRSFTVLMCLVCFFAAMLITNDVALITFVPLTLLMLQGQKELYIIWTVVLETVAVNLGSMLTPIGNPQNLYLFSQSGNSVSQFVVSMLPITVLSLVLVIICAFLSSKAPLVRKETAEFVAGLEGTSNLRKPSWFKISVYVMLFFVCLLNVFHVLEYPLVFAVVFLAVLITDRKVLLKVDYCLLLTFVAFFVFIGNIGMIPMVRDWLKYMISGRELVIGVVASQVFSNVPAAMLLSKFSSDIKGLLWGVNIGGLGTLIASMASLISYKFYAAGKNAKKGKYFFVFTALNVVLLIILLLVAMWII